jgi:hypothetical protein
VRFLSSHAFGAIRYRQSQSSRSFTELPMGDEVSGPAVSIRKNLPDSTSRTTSIGATLAVRECGDIG